MTKNGQDPLLSEEENCSEPIEIPNALEVNHAVTRRMSHLFCVVSDPNYEVSLLMFQVISNDI